MGPSPSWSAERIIEVAIIWDWEVEGDVATCRTCLSNESITRPRNCGIRIASVMRWLWSALAAPINVAPPLRGGRLYGRDKYMLTPAGNFHKCKLPTPGSLGRITGLVMVDETRLCIAESYSLCDNVLPWSIGIHTVIVRFLDNSERKRIAGMFFYEEVL